MPNKKLPVNPTAYAEAKQTQLVKPGTTVNMSIEAACYYLQMHNLKVLGWRHGTLLVAKATENPISTMEGKVKS